MNENMENDFHAKFVHEQFVIEAKTTKVKIAITFGRIFSRRKV